MNVYSTAEFADYSFDDHVLFKKKKESGILRRDVLNMYSNRKKSILNQELTFKFHKISRNMVFDVALPESQDSQINVKHTNNSLYNQIRSLFIKSKAKKSYEAALKLKSCGLNTPQPLGYIEERNLFLVKESSYLCESIKDGVKLRQYFWAEDRSEAERVMLVKAVAGICKILHSNGIIHNDLNMSNIIVNMVDDGIKLSIIDLNRCSYPMFITPFHLVNDISRLKFKNYNHLFMQCYDSSNSLNKYQWFASMMKKLRGFRRKLSRKMK